MIVWSFGGGTQSAAIAVLVCQGRLPQPDHVVIADTGREVSTTWSYMREVIGPALTERGISIEVAGHDLATVDLYGKNGDLLLPGFTSQDGHGKLPTLCSNEWKQRVIRRHLRAVGVESCDVWIGISTDEYLRMKDSGLAWYRHVYPLIDIVPMSRAACIDLVKEHGWPAPPRSRCWMCPNQGPSEWAQLQRELPADFTRAVDLEREIRIRDSHVYLTKYAKPLGEVSFHDEAQGGLFDGCDSGYCWT